MVNDFCVSSLSACNLWAISGGFMPALSMAAEVAAEEDADLLSDPDLATAATALLLPDRAALQSPLCAGQWAFWQAGLQ